MVLSPRTRRDRLREDRLAEPHDSKVDVKQAVSFSSTSLVRRLPSAHLATTCGTRPASSTSATKCTLPVALKSGADAQR